MALVVIPSVLYLSLAVYLFLYPSKLRLFKIYGDTLFISLLSVLSQSKEALFSLVIPMAMHANRNPSSSLLTLWLLIGLGYYYYGLKSLVFLPLFVALYLSPLSPELVDSLRKERYYIRKLRKAYQNLTKELGAIERSAQERSEDATLLDALLKSGSLEDYLKNIKSAFGLRAISIHATRETLSQRKVDRDSGSVHIPVKLEKGFVYVVFYVSNPLELYDRRLLEALEKSAKLINLYVEGFEGGEKASKLAV